MYTINWMGPFYSLPEALKTQQTENGCIYIVTGKKPGNCKTIGIRYVGISGRDPLTRMYEKDDYAKISTIRCAQYWIGQFSVDRYNVFGPSPDPKRKKAELVEHLIVRYISLLRGEKSLVNEKKTKRNPFCPVVIVSRGIQVENDEFIYYPGLPVDLPPVLMFDGEDFSFGKRLYKLKI